MTVDLQLDRTKPRRRRGDQRDAINLFLGIDIGGTKIAAGVVDPHGTLLSSASVPTPRGQDPEGAGSRWLGWWPLVVSRRACDGRRRGGSPPSRR